MEWMHKLYEKYAAEQAAVLPEAGLDFAQFRERIAPQLAGMQQITIEDAGILCYSLWEEADYQVCDVPVYGYCAASEKALSMLFCQLADTVMAHGTTLFQVHLYAHDLEAQRLFAMMQFGYMAETDVCSVWDFAPCESGCTIRTLSKAEISENWDALWEMTHGIIRHLQSAPVFYPGTEFTEEVYRAFYLEDDTSVHAAFSADGQMIGIIETNAEANWFVGGSSQNVGEVYVLPAYRKTGAAQALLSYAAAYARAQGADTLWVTHGTANPNARHFWGSRFHSYAYEMNRKIELEWIKK